MIRPRVRNYLNLGLGHTLYGYKVFAHRRRRRVVKFFRACHRPAAPPHAMRRPVRETYLTNILPFAHINCVFRRTRTFYSNIRVCLCLCVCVCTCYVFVIPCVCIAKRACSGIWKTVSMYSKSLKKNERDLRNVYNGWRGGEKLQNVCIRK